MERAREEGAPGPEAPRASLNGPQLPALADLARLKRDAAGLPVQPNDLQELWTPPPRRRRRGRRRRRRSCAPRDKGKSGAASSPPTLEEAEKALVVGAAVPARCDELEALELAVEEARAWVEAAREADEADRPVEVLEALAEKATNGALRVVPRARPRRSRNARGHARGRTPPRRWRRGSRVGSLAEVRECVRAGAEIIEGPSASSSTCGGASKSFVQALAEEKEGPPGA